jgi:hypothetical protein
MPLDLQQTYIRRQQKDRAETSASIVQMSGVAILALLLSAVLLLASAKYGLVPDPETSMEQWN